MVELFVSFQELCEPEAQRGGLPGELSPQVWHAGVEYVVQGITEVLGGGRFHVINARRFTFQAQFNSKQFNYQHRVNYNYDDIFIVSCL